ncbi:hypothetical protein AOLI_G00101850 [Acnodon oligacanthus]
MRSSVVSVVVKETEPQQEPWRRWILFRVKCPKLRNNSRSYGGQLMLHVSTQAFSQHLGQCGMSRDSSFNTSLDHSRVYDCPNLQNTI